MQNLVAHFKERTQTEGVPAQSDNKGISTEREKTA